MSRTLASLGCCNFEPSIKQVGWTLTLSAVLGACGSVKSNGPKDSAKGSTVSTEQNGQTSNSDAKASGPISFEVTADYKLRPVDVIIIRDGASHVDPIDNRLNSALPLLTARLWNLGALTGSVHVGVFDHYFRDDPNDTVVPPNSGSALIASTTVQGSTEKAPDHRVLLAESLSATDFSDSLEMRIQTAGSRGGTYRPASVLLAALDESKKPGGGGAQGLFRPDAYWAVLLVGATLNPDDPLDVQDVLTAVKDHPGGIAISSLALDRTSCAFVGVTPERETNKPGMPQRNLEIKLQEATGGIFGSFCPKTYALFMDDFANKATGTQYFSVALPQAVKGDTIQIATSTDAIPVKEFRYIPGSTNLEISTIVPVGTKLKVTATSDGPVKTPIVGTDKGDPNVPQAGETQLPPEQVAFLKDTAPALQRNCGSCHNGRPYNTAGGYASATAYKAEIARRVQLPTSDTARMPQGGVTIPAADMTAILNWASK